MIQCVIVQKSIPAENLKQTTDFEWVENRSVELFYYQRHKSFATQSTIVKLGIKQTHSFVKGMRERRCY